MRRKEWYFVAVDRDGLALYWRASVAAFESSMQMATIYWHRAQADAEASKIGGRVVVVK